MDFQLTPWRIGPRLHTPSFVAIIWKELELEQPFAFNWQLKAKGVYVKIPLEGKNLRPYPHVSRYFLILNFFFADLASSHMYLMNPADKSTNFWFHSPEWKLLITLRIQNRANAKSRYSLIFTMFSRQIQLLQFNKHFPVIFAVDFTMFSRPIHTRLWY